MNKTITITPELIEWVERRVSKSVGVLEVAVLMGKYNESKSTTQTMGNKPTEPKCALGRNTRSPADDATIRKLNARMWHEQGKGIIEPSKLPNSTEKLWLIGYFEQQYGKRRCDNEDNPMNPFED